MLFQSLLPTFFPSVSPTLTLPSLPSAPSPPPLHISSLRQSQPAAISVLSHSDLKRELQREFRGLEVAVVACSQIVLLLRLVHISCPSKPPAYATYTTSTTCPTLAHPSNKVAAIEYSSQERERENERGGERILDACLGHFLGNKFRLHNL